MKFKIFTDTSAGLTEEMIKTYDIGVVALSFIKEGELYNSEIIGSEKYYKDFYEMLRNKDNLSTACANTESFIDAFEPHLKNGRDLLYIGFSSGLSATYSCAKAAVEILKEKYKDRKIYEIDSLLASFGQGLLVYNTAVLAEEGKEIEEVYDYAIKAKERVNSLFTVKTLAYLARGGRVSKMSFAIGTVVDIKPLMYVSEEGKLLAYGKVIGRKRSILSIADKVCKTIIDPEKQTVFISHGDCVDDAKYLAKLIEEKAGVKKFEFNYIDPVIGVHSGPDTLAIFYQGLNRKESIEYSGEAVSAKPQAQEN